MRQQCLSLFCHDVMFEARRVTYSPAVTLVPTYECFNRCSYCNFRTDPHQDRWLSLEKAQQYLQQARQHGVIEALILSGEVHPHSSRRADWFQLIYDLCKLALSLGLLPHTNVGPLSEAEMSALRSVNVSMGLMVEQVTPSLLQDVHRYAPSKLPTVRLEQLEQAGRLQIPFTTGLLLGIGESEQDRWDTLDAIAACHDRWGHIQEVILQPHQPGSRQVQGYEPFVADALADFVTIAKQRLPPEIVIQIPPNLMDSQAYVLQAIANGARDLGGIGPLDEVNPDYPHPTAASLAQLLQSAGWELRPRLPIHKRYLDWLTDSLQTITRQWQQQVDAESHIWVER